MKEDALYPQELVPLNESVREALLAALERAGSRSGGVYGAPVGLDGDTIGPLLVGIHPADIADFMESLPRDKRDMLTSALPQEALGDILIELEDGAQEHMLATLDSDVVKEVISELESDDAVDIARQLEDSDETDEDHAEAKKFLSDKQQKRLFEYDADTAGGLMQLELVTALPEQKVKDVLKYLRTEHDNLPGNPGTIFVVNDKRKLLGTVSLSRLVRCPPNKDLTAVMRENPLTLLPDASEADVVNMFEKYDIHNVAVVNKRGALLGRITIDDVLDVVMEGHERQTARAAGVEEGEDIFAPIWATTSKRLPWLIINLFTAVLASLVIAMFQDDIQRLVALAVLMPIVASMGGNAGTQTMTVAVRGLATGKLTWSNALYLLRKEVSIGGLNGVFLGLLLALGTFVFYQDAALAGVIATATVANHLFAAFAGHLIPIMLKKMKYDPAISSGVLVTTVTDVGGFFVFLGLAGLVLL